MHPETDVLHRGEGARDGATPLTTPIYATSTFVFANAAELEAYQQGKSDKYIYSRYANPTRAGGRGEAGGARRRRVGARHLVRHGGDRDGAVRAAAGRATKWSAAPRSTAARCRSSPSFSSGSASRRGSRRSTSSPTPDRAPRPEDEGRSGSSRRSIRRCAASTSASVAAACRARGVIVDHRQHVREPGQSAAARARRRSGDALGDEVPERPQRRHRRRADRLARDHRAAAAGAEAVRRRARAGVGLRAGARHEDAGACASPARTRTRMRVADVARQGRRASRRVFYPGLAVASGSRDRQRGR